MILRIHPIRSEIKLPELANAEIALMKRDDLSKASEMLAGHIVHSFHHRNCACTAGKAQNRSMGGFLQNKAEDFSGAFTGAENKDLELLALKGWFFVVSDGIGLVAFAIKGVLVAIEENLHFFGVLTPISAELAAA